MNEKSYDTSSITVSRHKIVFVGDVNVGKTSIMNRFIEGKFSNQYDPSIGVDFHAKTIHFRDEQLKLQFWDSAGQEKYKSLIPSYVRGASFIFIIFDKSSKASFVSLTNWIKFIKNIRAENALLILCGNKIDLET
jgi:small GTP-binding protein